MFHINHKYEEVDRQFAWQQEYSPPIFGCVPIGREQRVTLITYKCIKCPKHRQEVLNGWIDERV